MKEINVGGFNTVLGLTNQECNMLIKIHLETTKAIADKLNAS